VDTLHKGGGDDDDDDDDYDYDDDDDDDDNKRDQALAEKSKLLPGMLTARDCCNELAAPLEEPCKLQVVPAHSLEAIAIKLAETNTLFLPTFWIHWSLCQ
jgi:hypothetical protein